MRTKPIQRHAAALLALCLTLVAHEATAQMGELTPERVAMALKRTDEVLANTARFIRETESAKARFVLENALQIQAKARETFQSGLNPLSSTLLKLSLKLTLEAREQAMRARVIAKEDQDREQGTMQAIERARALFERAEAHARDTSLDPVREERVRHLLTEARKQIRASMGQMREHQYKVAFGLAVSAQGLCEQALKLMRDERAPPEEVRRQVARTQRLLEEAVQTLATTRGPRAAGLLDKATDLQEKAQQRLLDAQFRAALRLTLEARQFVHRALRMSEDRGSPERVRRSLRQTDNLLERTRSLVQEAGDPEAQSLFEEGRKLQEQALDLFGKGTLDAALDRTLEARSSVQRALALLDRTVGRAEAERAVTLTGDLLERARPEVGAAGNQDAAHLLERAAYHLGQARERFAGEDYAEALARARLARRLVLRALKAVESGGPDL